MDGTPYGLLGPHLSSKCLKSSNLEGPNEYQHEGSQTIHEYTLEKNLYCPALTDCLFDHVDHTREQTKSTTPLPYSLILHRQIIRWILGPSITSTQNDN